MRKLLPGLFFLVFISMAAAAPSYDPTQPLQLKFTDIGSQQVDLSTMRGKVVLIDFWASSNAACRQNEFQVTAAYRKYHDLGFEIIGISLDTDKRQLLRFIQENGMFWSQYYDGLGIKYNRISSRFGVDSIPSMWLIDQKGMVVTTDVGDHLGGKVKKLLNLH